jgi:hypothetical protein
VRELSLGGNYNAGVKVTRSQGKHCLHRCIQSKPWRCLSNPCARLVLREPALTRASPVCSDAVLEQLTKMTVAEIFETEGEEEFRAVETQVPPHARPSTQRTHPSSTAGRGPQRNPNPRAAPPAPSPAALPAAPTTRRPLRVRVESGPGLTREVERPQPPPMRPGDAIAVEYHTVLRATKC